MPAPDLSQPETPFIRGNKRNAVLLKVVLTVALMALIFGLVMGANLLLIKPIYKANQGQLDVSAWEADGNVSIKLAGDWAIFWGEYLDSSQINTRLSGNTNFLELPGIWNGKSYGEHVLPPQGHATLVLDIMLPKDGKYVLKIPALYNSYRLWINGEQKVANPSLDDKFRRSQSISKTRVVSFSSNAKKARVLMHVANYRHRVGGVWEVINLSAAENKDTLYTAAVQRDLVVLSVLGVVALALVFLAWKEKRKAYIFLALWAVFMALRAGTIDERILFTLFWVDGWELQQKLEYLFLYLSIPFFTLYLGYRFPRYFPPLLHWNVVALSAALVIMVLLTPASVYSHTILIFQVAVVTYAFFWLAATLQYVWDNRREAWWLLLGSVALIAAAMNDILLANVLFEDSLLNGANVSHYGAVVFILCASVLYLIEPYPEPIQVQQCGDAITAQTPLQLALESYEQDKCDDHKRLLCFEVMVYALALWEKAGHSKLDFAEQSGLWRVTNDEGSLKTRTLDKYLKLDSLPKKPRYRTVVKSVEYVAEQVEGLAESDKSLLFAASRFLGR